MRTVCLSGLLLEVFLLAGGALRAQPLVPQVDSLDCLVANADMVVIATVVDFRPPSGDERKGFDVTIEIRETLKHPALWERFPRRSVFLPVKESALTDWQARASRLLVACDADAPLNNQVLELVPGRMEVLTADFQLLLEPAAVIKAARQVVRHQPVGVKRIQTFKLHVPREIVKGTQWEPAYDMGAHLVLSVPVDERLKKWAQDALHSSDRLTRSEGEQALRYFSPPEQDPAPADGQGR